MILLPFTQFTIETELSIEQAMKNLIDEVDSADSLPKKNGEKRIFRGELDQYKFRMFRSVYYLNIFQPVVYGSIKSFVNVTKIDVTMRPTYFGLAIMLFWLSVTIRSFFYAKHMAAPIIMTCVFFGFHFFGFLSEARKAEKELMRFFDEGNKVNL